MFEWNADKIRFLQDAAEYTPFYGTLADQALRFFAPEARVLDAGCGLGYLSLALAETCARITAADTSPEALGVLRENMEKSGVRNIDIWEGDVFSLPKYARFDNAVFCFFGSTENILRCIKTHCRGTAVIFKKSWQTHRFTAKATPLTHFTYQDTCRELKELGVPYASEIFDLEMGQPFHSLEDAMLFFRVHQREGSGSISEEELALRLKPTDSPLFPYYLPSCRPVGMITVKAGDIPEFI